MGKITVSSLQAGCKELGIETSSKKAKELEGFIDKKLSEMELGYECPSCAKDIPDVKICPYCGESFEEEVNPEEENNDENNDTTDEETAQDIDSEIEEISKDVVEKVVNDDVIVNKKQNDKKDNKKVSSKAADKKDNKKDDKKVSDKETNKNDNKKIDDEATDKKDNKKGRSKGSTMDTQKKNEDFAALVSEIDTIFGNDFEKRERKTGITYVKDGKRILKAVSTGKMLVIEFNSAIESDVDGLIKYTEEEAKQKHLGTTKAVYDGGDTNIALDLIKEALKNFGK